VTEYAKTELADLVPRFRQMAAEAGRDPASLPISVWGRRPDMDLMKRYQDLEVDRIVTSLDAARADVILPVLDVWAELIRKVNG
jgi:hypothetical protein